MILQRQAALKHGVQKIFYIYVLFNRKYLQIGRSIMTKKMELFINSKVVCKEIIKIRK